jgi:hypothetical protein
MTLFRNFLKSAPASLGTTSAAVLLVATLAGQALAGGGPPPGAVPEVDPGSLASALTLLVGGVLALRGRIRR